MILRLAGIYGPGRIPRMAALIQRRPVPARPGGHLNLIHVDDAVEAVLAAESRVDPPRTYVLSDGHPTERRAFYIHLAQLLQVPGPEFVDPPPDEGAERRGASSKRVSNARVLAELGLTLRYPTFREGLQAIVLEHR
jgi:nucleoside-diphosphate-sugar epimerase